METKITSFTYTKRRMPMMMKHFLLACVFCTLCAGSAYGQETLQLKFSNVGVQTADGSDYVTTLTPGDSYRAVVSAYLQGETAIPAATTVTAILRYGDNEMMMVSDGGDNMTANFDAPSAANSNISITIEASITTAGQTYGASVEIDYPNSSEQADSDNDGVPNSIDTDPPIATRVAAKTSGNSVATYLEASGDDSLVVLGNEARKSENYQAELTEAYLGEANIDAPPGYEDQGIYDFAFFHSQTVYTYVTVPLAEPSIRDKSWYVYDDGDWKSFKRDNEGDEERIEGVDDANEYYSAEGTLNEGVLTCPAPNPNNAQWTSTGVVEAGHQCVLLAIFDGGPNDGDGVVNGFVSQLGAPGQGQEPGQEALQLKFSNAGVQTASEDYSVTALEPDSTYKVVVSAYLQGEVTDVSVATMVTATLKYGDDEMLVSNDGDNMTAEFVTPSSDNPSVSITIDASVTEAGQTYKASVELYYPNSGQQTDRDNDGVPDSVDTALSLATRVAAKTSGSSVVTYLEVSGDDSRIVLGNRARQLGVYRAELTTTDLETLDMDINVPPGYDGQGIYDFAFFHSQTVYTYVTVPLAEPSMEAKSWYVYDEGDWKLFKRNNEGDEEQIDEVADVNEYYSAEGTLNAGVLTCPAPNPNNAQWTSTGVVEAGHQCVLLAIFDGGPNDGDGEVNGFVTQLGAPGSEIAESGSSGGSSGASDLWLLMLLLAMLALTPLVRRCRFATP